MTMMPDELARVDVLYSGVGDHIRRLEAEIAALKAARTGAVPEAVAIFRIGSMVYIEIFTSKDGAVRRCEQIRADDARVYLASEGSVHLRWYHEEDHHDAP